MMEKLALIAWILFGCSLDGTPVKTLFVMFAVAVLLTAAAVLKGGAYEYD